MWARALARVGLVAIGLMLAVILLEVVLQIASLFVEGPVEPGATAWRTDGQRILSLGDSNTYGVWLTERESEAYPAQLERIWNDTASRPAEVLNLGYPGTNSSRLLGLYPEFIETYAPQVVLVMIGVNDFWTEPVASTDAESGIGLFAFVRRHSRLYKGLYILSRRSGAQTVDSAGDPLSRFDPGEETFLAADREVPVTLTQRRKIAADLRNNLRRLATLSESSPARLVFMTYPGRFRYYRLANAAIRDVAQERGISLIDHTRVFEPLCPELKCPDWLFEDQHPKAAGYRLVAETITSRLSEFLPRSE